VKDSRIGECLWSLWEGEGYDIGQLESIVYHTEDHVDLDHEIVRKALASSIQRDGIVYSLHEAFNLIDRGSISLGWVGDYDGNPVTPGLCSQNGSTASGLELQNIRPATFVEVYDVF
jgi:hypothetical protein